MTTPDLDVIGPPLPPGQPCGLWVTTPRDDREQEFLDGLGRLLNATGMDSQCGTPDYILAELVLGQLRAFRQARLEIARNDGRPVREVAA